VPAVSLEQSDPLPDDLRLVDCAKIQSQLNGLIEVGKSVRSNSLVGGKWRLRYSRAPVLPNAAYSFSSVNAIHLSMQRASNLAA